MNFGQAIEALKGGGRVQRTGWNGKSMWLALWSAGMAASIVMKTADGSLVFGWLASQTDMLAEDWRVCE